MPDKQTINIEHWTIDNLENLPSEESDFYEYKSSQIVNNPDKLANVIAKAASAFWNIGGGYFMLGITDDGEIEGGVPKSIGKKGRQSIEDWVDQIIFRVSPPGQYQRKFISLDHAGNGVLVIYFEESTMYPHQATDNIYYVRVGAHSQPASHYIIEALRAKRATTEPKLVARVMFNQQKYDLLDLVISATNSAVAYDVTLDFDPLPHKYTHEYAKSLFPLNIPYIDSKYPFSMELGSLLEIKKVAKHPFNLKLSYFNAIGQSFQEIQYINIYHHILDWTFGDTATYSPSEKILNSIAKQLTDLNKNLTKFLEDNS